MTLEPWGTDGGVVLAYENLPRGGLYVRWTADRGVFPDHFNVYRQRTADNGGHWMTEESHTIPWVCVRALLEYLGGPTEEQIRESFKRGRVDYDKARAASAPTGPDPTRRYR